MEKDLSANRATVFIAMFQDMVQKDMCPATLHGRKLSENPMFARERFREHALMISLSMLESITNTIAKRLSDGEIADLLVALYELQKHMEDLTEPSLQEQNKEQCLRHCIQRLQLRAGD